MLDMSTMIDRHLITEHSGTIELVIGEFIKGSRAMIEYIDDTK